MRFKTAKRILKKKLEHWIDSIEDKEIGTLVRENVLVSGGAIASLIMGEKVNDYDVYFKTKESTAKVAAYYVGQFTKNPPPRFKESGKNVPRTDTLRTRTGTGRD